MGMVKASYPGSTPGVVGLRFSGIPRHLLPRTTHRRSTTGASRYASVDGGGTGESPVCSTAIHPEWRSQPGRRNQAHEWHRSSRSQSKRTPVRMPNSGDWERVPLQGHTVARARTGRGTIDKSKFSRRELEIHRLNWGDVV